MTNEFILIAIIVLILVSATKLLHSALRTQVDALQQQVMSKEEELCNERNRYTALQQDKKSTESQLKIATSRADDLQQCFFRIGIDGQYLSTLKSDPYYREAALLLIRCTIDETAINSSNDAKTNASIIGVANMLIKKKSEI